MHACRSTLEDPTDVARTTGNLSALAKKTVHELFLRGPAEVGVTEALVTTLELAPSTRPAVDRALLTANDVIVISGGARGVTAACALAFAEKYQPTLVLLGRSPLPDEEPEWLRSLTDEREIKRALSARNGAVTPRELNRKYQALAAGREVRENLRRLTAAGSLVAYRPVDVRDAQAVTTVLERVRTEFGPITGLVHGAGVIEDRLILDKTDEQFDRVVGTKVEGLLNLLAATEGDALKVLALFSSSTGRFGRSGQADYAVANEVLNKLARREAQRRSACRVVSVNWGPWEGGMVTPELARLFTNEGVGLIPLRDGAQFLLEELSATDRPIEVVAGVWLDQPPTMTKEPEPEPMAVESDPALTMVWEREVDIASHPILASHVIDDRAVVPLALQMEWLIHAAMHGNPGLAFHGLNDCRILNGIKMTPEESRTISAQAGKTRRVEGAFIVPVELRGTRSDGRPIIHSRAEIVLTNSLNIEPPRLNVDRLAAYPSNAAIYDNLLFHGDELQGIARVEGISAVAITAIVRPASSPSTWMQRPLRQNWLTDPLAIDCAFQLLILWGIEHRGMPNLPAGFTRFRQFRRQWPTEEIQIVARIAPGNGPMIRADIEWVDSAGLLIARIEGGEFVGEAKLAAAFRRNRIATTAV